MHVPLDAHRPRISIGIPFRDPGPCFEMAVRSVFAQSMQDWELVLVNDGSTDGSVELAGCIEDERVILVDDGNARGLVFRLNQIAMIARGIFLARMDADDIMHPSRVETQYRYLCRRPDVDVVDSAAVILDEHRYPFGKLGGNGRAFDVYTGLKHGFVIHPSIMAKREWFLANPYDEEYPRAEDRELFARVAGSSTTVHLPQPLLFYFGARRVRTGAFLRSYSSERKVLLAHGRRLLPASAVAKLYLRSLLKSLLLPVVVGLGRDAFVTRRMNAPLSASEAAQANDILAGIRAQPVPGWPSLKA